MCSMKIGIKEIVFVMLAVFIFKISVADSIDLNKLKHDQNSYYANIDLK